MKGIIRTIFLGIALISVFAVGSASAQAQGQGQISQSGLTVGPAIFEMIVEPGETKSQAFFVNNIKDTPVPVTTTIKRLSPIEEEIDLTLSESFNAASWIEVSEPHHILKGRERRRLEATVTVPETAEPGGHYATIVLEPMVSAFSTGQSTAKVASQIGILVFITVKGDAITEATFRDNPQLSRLQTSRSVPVTAAVANTGTIHVLPSSKLVVRNLFGFNKTELPLKPRLVLPNTIKKFTTEWGKAPVLGIYSVQAVGTYGSGQTELVSGKKYFVVVRWLPILVSLVLLLAAGTFIIKTHKRWPQAYRAFMGEPAPPKHAKSRKPVKRNKTARSKSKRHK